MRDNELYLVEIDAITFNHRDFNKILIPINHINFDKEGQRRSEYTVEEVAETLCLILDQLELLPDGRRESTEYFVYIFKMKLQ